MLQGFGWESCNTPGGFYNAERARLPAIKEAGITHMWLPPPSQSVSPQGYMPTQLYNLNSGYGSRVELQTLIEQIRASGIQPLADIVINHRCADEQADGVWNIYHDDVDHRGKRLDWRQWAITRDDPCFRGQGNFDTGEDFGAAPDLDHTNPAVKEALQDWLGWLSSTIGFQGWRFDFTTGYGAGFVRDYVDSSVGADALNVAEYWVDMLWDEHGELQPNQDPPRQKICDWINAAGARSSAFDFPTKGILQEAVKRVQYHRLADGSGGAPGVLGWWPQKAVTFVDNHDTGGSQGQWPFPTEHVALGYAYILTHPGTPCIFSEHLFENGDALRNAILSLVGVRRRNNLQADSRLRILCAESDMYVAEVAGRVVVKLGPRLDMGPLLPRQADGWHLATEGNDFAVWERPA
ncbi:MAG: hypothetical protein WDW36_005141 [Sanguina aurantia]